MNLLETWLDIVMHWRVCFPQKRSALRAIRQGLGALVCLGRRTISRMIWTNGGEQESWAAEYFLHSRVQWDPQKLFEPVLAKALPLCTGRLIGVAMDDARLHKTGRCIKQAFFQRDPLSPPFHSNLMLGLRFLQASLLVPLHKRHAASCRALPIGFEESSPVKHPGKKASDEEKKACSRARKEHNLSTHFVAMMARLRTALDAAGGAAKLLRPRRRRQFLQQDRLRRGTLAHGDHCPRPQRCGALFARAGKFQTLLCPGEIHAREDASR